LEAAKECAMPPSEDPRPDNREVENENLNTNSDGEPRPATEPGDGKASTRTTKTAVDPASGLAPEIPTSRSGS
jgi:hypothetical protein